jgi:hypothetical protein
MIFNVKKIIDSKLSKNEPLRRWLPFRSSFPWERLPFGCVAMGGLKSFL